MIQENYYKKFIDEGVIHWCSKDTHDDMLKYIRYLPGSVSYKYLMCLQVNTCRQFLTVFEYPDFNIETS